MQDDAYSFRDVTGDVPVEELGLSARSTHALRNNGVLKLSQLFEVTEESLFLLRNLGAKSVKEILAAKAFFSEQFGISAGTADIALPDPIAPEPNRFLSSEGVLCEDIPLRSLDLSVRSYNCLKRGGYVSASQLIGITREDLLKIRNMGIKSADEILSAVKRLSFRAAEEGMKEPAAAPHDALQKERLTDFCREVYEGIGVTPAVLYAALEKMAADGASLTGESLYYRAYELPFMKTALRKAMYRILYDAEFAAVPRETLDGMLPAHLFNTTITDESLIDLENEGKIRETDEGYYLLYPRCMEYAASIAKDNARLCLTERLKGRTLEDIGQDHGWTRERVRQLVEKALNHRGRPRLYEDRYVYFFDTYYIQKEDFCSTFREPPETYEYLSLTVKKNAAAKKDIENTLTDQQLPEKWKRRLHKLVYKDYIFLDGQPVKIDRLSLVLHAVKRFAQEKISFDEFTETYLNWLEELGFAGREDLIYNKRTYENKISALNCVLWNFKNSFRYYDIGAVNAEEFFSAISVSHYSDQEISTLLLFRSYPEVMEDYDIRDEYELHNLLRKLEIDKKLPELQIQFGKMPKITFGAGNAESQALELMFESAPISAEDLGALYEMRYGSRKETVMGMLFRCLYDYYYQGNYNIDEESLTPEELQILQGCLTKDFYIKKDILRTYHRLFPDGDPKRINVYSLKTLGFHVYESYVISQRYRSASDYFDHLLLDQPITDMNDVDSQFAAITAYSSELNKLKASRKIVEFAPKQYITIERLNECGITLAEIERYCEDVAALTDEGAFFTVQSLRNSGFSDTLDDYGFDEWFYLSLLREDRERFSYRRVANSCLFCRGVKTVQLSDFFVSIMLKEQQMDIYDFCELLESQYGLSINIYKVKALVNESGMYYDPIMERIYIDYETYYEEV